MESPHLLSHTGLIVAAVANYQSAPKEFVLMLHKQFMLHKLFIHVIITAYLFYVFRKCSLWIILARLSNCFSLTGLLKNIKHAGPRVAALSFDVFGSQPRLASCFSSVSSHFTVRSCLLRLLSSPRTPATTHANYLISILKDGFSNDQECCVQTSHSPVPEARDFKAASFESSEGTEISISSYRPT